MEKSSDLMACCTAAERSASSGSGRWGVEEDFMLADTY
jgi:hypothetical protein